MLCFVQLHHVDEWQSFTCKLSSRMSALPLIKAKNVLICFYYTKAYLTIEFEDETLILIEVGCSPCFGITHLARGPHGDPEPVKRPMRGSIRSLVKGRR
jgi:hypothetical protein